MDPYNFGPYVIPTCTPSMVPLFIMYDSGLDNDRRGFWLELCEGDDGITLDSNHVPASPARRVSGSSGSLAFCHSQEP